MEECLKHLSRRRLLQLVQPAGAVALLPGVSLAGEDAGSCTLKPGVLRIGTYFVNPPFEFVSDQQRVGFEVDLMNAVAGRLGLKPVFVNTRWEIILHQIQQNSFDCIIGAITITPARQRLVAFSVPYMTTTLSLVVNSARAPANMTLADLKGGTVGVQAATTDYDAAIAMQKAGEIGEVKVYPFAQIDNAMTDLAVGRITAVMKVYPVAAWLSRRTPHLRILGQVPNDPQPLGIGFNRSNTCLLGKVNGALADLQRDGTYKALAAHWGVG